MMSVRREPSSGKDGSYGGDDAGIVIFGATGKAPYFAHQEESIIGLEAFMRKLNSFVRNALFRRPYD